MAHGFSGTRELRLDAYAERFCAEGIGAFVFDYRFFGASGGRPRQVVDIPAQLDDWRQAVSFARGIPWADPARVALFGTSFSGGHVVFIGAEDPKIAAIVAQCPFQNGLATARKLGPLAAVLLGAHGLVDQAAALLGLPPHYIPAVGSAGHVGLMTTPDAKTGFEALVPEHTLWENRVAARIALRLVTYRPGARAPKVRAPTLWCLADHDSLCPADDAAKWAASAPRGEVLRYPTGHFDFYVGDWFEKALADQVQFLKRHLLAEQVD
jgi:pimeloyl-ACP methyl ester carboxylesterase